MGTVQITIDIRGVFHELDKAIARARWLTAFGLTAGHVLDTVPESLPGERLPMRLPPPFDPGLDSIRAEHATWTLTQGLRDAIEAAGGALEEARKACAIFALMRDSGGSATYADFEREVTGKTPKFHRLGLPDKLDKLGGEFGDGLRPELSDQILTINQARNCLVHRRGIVSARDLNDGDVLRVRWSRMELMVQGHDGATRAVERGDLIRGGEGVGVRSIERTAEFKESEVVSFGIDDFSDICMTLHFFGRDLTRRVNDFGANCGFGAEGAQE